MRSERRKTEESSDLTERLNRLQEDCEAMLDSVRSLTARKMNAPCVPKSFVMTSSACVALDRGSSKGIRRVNDQVSPKGK